MSDTYSYEVLEPGGHARLVGNVLDRISRASANPASAVGSASALLGDPETASWTERTTAADGAALIEALHGRTLVWNQLIKSAGTSDTVNGVTFTNNGDGTWTVNGTATANAHKYAHFLGSSIITLTLGHTYLYKGCPSGGSLTTYYMRDSYSGRASDAGNGVIFTYSTGNANFQPDLFVTSGTTVSNIVFIPQLFDLTAMFGAGNEPATVTEFEAMFPEPYYPYDPGSLLPVRIEGVETVAADESWSSEQAVPASTYFPDGMRSAGSVHDELRADAAVTRVGAVDLGTLTWVYVSDNAYFYAIIADKAKGFNNIRCAKYETAAQAGVVNLQNGQIVGGNNDTAVYVKDSAYTDEATFKAAMSGVMLHYALATSTTTPIDPPLPLSYRVGAGGTERVMVASGTTSAPPIFVTRYPLDPADLAASIAPRESATAEANHAVGDLVMLGFTLCKVTTSIARGETITIGTNVTRTSVAAEIAALS